jgi:hypothetical protein
MIREGYHAPEYPRRSSLFRRVARFLRALWLGDELSATGFPTSNDVAKQVVPTTSEPMSALRDYEPPDPMDRDPYTLGTGSLL